MTLKEKGTSKKVAGIVLASALIVGSLGSISAFAANRADAVQKNSVISVPPTAAAVTPDASTVAQGSIQYSKNVYARTDGSQNFTMESWYDPETKDYKSDVREYSADQQLLSYRSTYRLNNNNEIVVIQRGSDGNPLSGKMIARADDPEQFEIFDAKEPYMSFSKIKESYKGSSWTQIGTETAPDGKTLDKVMRSYQSYIDDTTQANMQLIEFLDSNTGLPVKEELYEDSTGQAKLFSTTTSEDKYVTDDGSLFSTDEITLTPVQTLAATYQK